jgi:hypothetical protein
MDLIVFRFNVIQSQQLAQTSYWTTTFCVFIFVKLIFLPLSSRIDEIVPQHLLHITHLFLLAISHATCFLKPLKF